MARVQTVTQWGFRGVRVGEAANPGPPSRRRRMQRRALQWSWDSDSDSGDEQNVAPRLEPEDGEQAISSPPSEVIRALEADLCGPPRAFRRVALVPQSPGATPDSVVDVPEPYGGSVDATQTELSASSVQVPSTIPASSGAVRRLVLVNSVGSDNFGLGE